MGDDMNERIKELAEQAGLDTKEIREDNSQTLYAFENFDLERFAELVLQNYISQIMTTEDRERFIREDEREANAKLCDEMGIRQTNQCLYDPFDCALSIRERGNHEKD
jgi:hypothetical protein